MAALRSMAAGRVYPKFTVRHADEPYLRPMHAGFSCMAGHWSVAYDWRVIPYL